MNSDFMSPEHYMNTRAKNTRAKPRLFLGHPAPAEPVRRGSWRAVYSYIAVFLLPTSRCPFSQLPGNPKELSGNPKELGGQLLHRL